MIGLALAGGGSRGAYQIGVYRALKKCHIKIDGFVGTSIGALNAAMLASNRDKELYNLWKSINIGNIFGFSDNFISNLEKNKVNLKLIKSGLTDFKKIILNKGISLDNYRKVIKDLNIEESLYKSNKDFGLVTVKFPEFKPLYLFKDDIKPKLLNEYIIASCYLPIFKMEKILDNKYYLDGGFYDNIPANALLKKGYDLVYAVNLDAIGVKRPYLDKSKVIEIKPSRNLGSILNVNKDKINKNIELGYFDTLKIIKKLDGYKYIFKKRSEFYYSFLLKNIKKRTLKETQTFFRTTDYKKLIIKSLEYVMKKEGYSYYEIYNPYKVIREIKKMKKKYGVYKFINQISIL